MKYHMWYLMTESQWQNLDGSGSYIVPKTFGCKIQSDDDDSLFTKNWILFAANRGNKPVQSSDYASAKSLESECNRHKHSLTTRPSPVILMKKHTIGMYEAI